MKHLGKTPPFREPAGEILPGSIAEVSYMKLGGFDQWVMIRGESLVNPPLILLHGGPGFSEMPFFRYYNAVLEKCFTVVYWDQRGSGKSFDSKIPKSSMTVEQFIADLDELVDMVCKRVGKKKVVILGHSWGSALGVLYAARFPEKVALYVGCEQIGDCSAAESASYAIALAEAERRHHRKALKELREMGPPPYRASSVFKERTWLQYFDGQLRLRVMWQMMRVFMGQAEFSIVDQPNLIRGFRFTMDAMWDEVSKINLIKTVPALQMPVFFFLSRRDKWIPPEMSEAYYRALLAPSKQLVWFEQSGHEPFVDEPEKFNAAMTELVRPAVV